MIDYAQPHSYTPSFLADKILTSRRALEGERKLVTVLFADVANYTSMSERLDPEEVHQIMDGCCRLLVDEIHRFEGAIDKFTGDGLMALFGAPIAHEDHAQRACYAALAIQEAVGQYGVKLEAECGIEFKIRVGLNSGPVIVGSIGSDLRMDYTAVGDTVNLASRMEGTSEPGTIVVSAHTHRIARDFFTFDPLGPIAVRGKAEPVEAFRLQAAREVDTRFGAAVARGLTRFVGRQGEIEALEEAFEKAGAGSGQVVGIPGEAGVGKSRLVRELRQVLPQTEYRFIEGRCLHYGESMPYLPVLDIVRACFDIGDAYHEAAIKKRMKSKVRQLGIRPEAVLPPLHSILSLRIEDEAYLKLDPPQKKERTFEAIKSLLVALSETVPLTIAVEDVHWIDNTSQEFLNYLIGSLATTRILLILLYRPEYSHSWGSRSFYSQVGVHELTAGVREELILSILDDAEVAPDVTALILSRAAGNPLFIEELTHTLLDNGSIQRNEGRYVLNARASDIHVPETVQGIIASRMDRLQENVKRTMQVASVIGRDFSYRILQIILGIQDELKRQLSSLQELEFIYEKSLFPELEYIFKHALTQEVAYESLLLRRRKKLHERIGNTIELLYADRLEEFYEVLAHHYSRSGSPEKAYEYLRRSGEKAARNSSNTEAFGFFREALDLLAQFPITETNKRSGVEVRLLMAGPMRLIAYPEPSLDILQEGARLSEELGDRASLAKFSSLIGACYSFRGDPARGMEYCEATFDIALKLRNVDLVAPTALDLCHSCFMTGDYARELKVAPKAIALLEKSRRESEFFDRPLNVYAGLLVHGGHASGIVGDFRRGEAWAEKALRFANSLGNQYSKGFVALVYGMLLGHKGDGEGALKLFRDACRHLEETQALIILGLAWSGLGWGHQLVGDPQTAREHVEKGLRIQSDTGIPFFLSLHHWRLGEAMLDLGDLQGARSRAEEAVRLAQGNNEKWAEGASRILFGRVLRQMDASRPEDAELEITKGMRILDDLKLKTYANQARLYLGELYLETGRASRAVGMLTKAEAAFKKMGMSYWVRRTHEALARTTSAPGPARHR